MLKITILLPVYNDWEAVSLLINKINHTLVTPHQSDISLSYLIVDDCSISDYTNLPILSNQQAHIIRLYRNLGHQKAITVGLAYLAKENITDRVIVMDSDGEDKPEDLPALISASLEKPEKIIFAHRTKRSESYLFRIFYLIYKLVFKLLTGKVITFGNYSIIPKKYLQNLTYVSEIWNNYPGGVIRSKLPYSSIPAERGVRLAGKSKMNFVSLVLHGLSAVSVLMDTTAVRILLFSVLISFLSGLAIAVIVVLRLFQPNLLSHITDFTLLSFIIVILQAFVISLFLVFIVLQNRTQKHFIPAKDALMFVAKVEPVINK